ncbi:hypothetical protein [Metabacillus litoralis]|uniref:hypothetical protein n=1 Tax=Metabacillus litoralis TaxID=152268 RepID=UPI0013CEA5B0|nr:hypothetical protein [Metabacillus litoralis]
MCLDTKGIGTEKVHHQEFVSRYKGNRDRKGLQAERCVPIQGESGQKRSSSRKMCLDTGGIGTENDTQRKDVSRYRQYWDRKDPPAGRCVPIQRESGQKRSSSRKMCLDTGGIGTEKVHHQEFVSRYKGNRDRKDPPAGICVSIQRESGQKRSSSRKICPDTEGIGTEKVFKPKDVSRYRGNRDRKGLQAERCVSIQRESRQKRSSISKMCPDTGRIGTEKDKQRKDVSRYRQYRYRKGFPAGICVSIQGEIGTEKVLQPKDVSRYRENRDRKDPPAERCVSIQVESVQKRPSRRKMHPDTEVIETQIPPSRKM